MFIVKVHNPRNTEALTLHFRGQKTAKVVGQLAINPPADNDIISGILVRRNFNYHLLHPNDLNSKLFFLHGVIVVFIEVER